MAAPACDSGEVGLFRDQKAVLRSRVGEMEEELTQSRLARQNTAEKLAEARLDLRESRRKLGRELGPRDVPGQGLVVAIPRVGRLTWRCNDARHFSFVFAPEGSTVTVEQSVDGRIDRKRLHPGGRLVMPFAPSKVERGWNVTLRSSGLDASAQMSVVASVHQGACFIRNSTLEQNERPN